MSHLNFQYFKNVIDDVGCEILFEYYGGVNIE